MNFSFETVQSLFSSIAPSYDRMNDIMSLGWHHFWKAYYVESFPWETLSSPFSFLDMACGSGDIGKLTLQRAHALDKEVESFFIDPNEAMLDQGKQKFEERQAMWIQACAEAIPMADSLVHLYSIVFGLRNTHDLSRSLREAYRVLMPGGWFYAMEFSQPTHPLMQEAYKIYLFSLPLLGQWVTGEKKPYEYLAQTILSFPSPQIIAMRMEEAGFKEIAYDVLSSGLVVIYKARK